MSLLWPLGILLFVAAAYGMLWHRHHSSRTSRAEPYKRVRVEVIRDALLVSFNGSRIHSEAELTEIGNELMQLVGQAADRQIALWLSFRGVVNISSALIGKLVLVNKKARELRVKFRMSDLSPPVAEVFRNLGLKRGLDR